MPCTTSHWVDSLNLRSVSAQVLVHVLADGQSLTAALEQKLPGLSNPKDKAFVQAVCYGVCRFYHQLEFILNGLLDKSLKDKDIAVKMLILIGLYQLKYMRVKPHAAVSETVSAVGRQAWAKGLVNAVLRKYQREQAVCDAQAQADPAAGFSHPEWLVKMLERDWPAQAGHCLEENNKPPPMALRVNERKISRPEYMQLLAEAGLQAEPAAFSPAAIVLAQPVPVEQLPGFSQGWVSVQDTAAQLAAGLLSLPPGQRVLDVCAAPGGKAAHILESRPDTELVAVEIDASRMQKVADNFRRLSLDARLITADAAMPETWWDGKQFDRILLDAPCSGLGVIRRHPDIKLLRRAEDIDALAEIQSTLLNAVWPLLKPGGLLLYATCSVLKRENEMQIQAFLQNQPDAVEIPIEAEWGIVCPHGRQILTGDSAMDGFYYARLGKQ